jgi:hypothetical protein
MNLSPHRNGEEFQSGRGLPQSKTLARAVEAQSVRQLLDCGSPLPLYHYRVVKSTMRNPRPSKNARRGFLLDGRV